MRTPVLALAALVITSPAAAAERNYSVVSFDHVRIDGGYRVMLKTGVAPLATASGSPEALDGLSVDVQGRTLIVHSNPSNWGGTPGAARGPVEITLGTHELSAAWVNGSGVLGIDTVKGLTFDLSVQGSGAAMIDAVDVDQFKLAVAGAGSARLSGRALRMTAVVRGTSSFDGSGLTVHDVTIGADGPSMVKLTATDTAKVDVMGLASVTLAGSPACVVHGQGSATVEGCKTSDQR